MLAGYRLDIQARIRNISTLSFGRLPEAVCKQGFYTL